MTLPLGQLVYVCNVNANILVYAVITDGSTPNLNTISMQINGDQATAIIPGLQGPPGPAGAPLLGLQPQPDIFTSPSQLPQDLNEDNFGDYWVIIQYDQNNNAISSTAYVWWNTFYRVVPIGTQGPIGPYPIITPQVILIDPDETSYVLNVGTISNPSWTFYLAVPQGPPGPSATIAGCPDVKEVPPPTPGQVLGFNGAYNQGLPVYQPMTLGTMNPLPYTVPESAFQTYKGISTQTQTVCTFTIPANPWPWKPIVLGQLEVFGVNLSLNPLLVGAEVLLNSPDNGQLLAVGYGNAFGGAVTIVPQTSDSSNTNTAMTPQNSTALVPAGQTVTIYVNLVNHGMAGVYDFNAENAQLFIMAVPVSTEGAVAATAVYGSLTPQVSLSADVVVSATSGGALLPKLSAFGALSATVAASVPAHLSAHGSLGGIVGQAKLHATGTLTCTAHPKVTGALSAHGALLVGALP